MSDQKNSTQNNNPPNTGQLLSIFIQLEKQIWATETKQAHSFISCNSTKSLIDYEYALFWEQTQLKSPKILTVSGATEVGQHSAFVDFWERIIRAKVDPKTITGTQSLTGKDILEANNQTNKNFIHEKAHILILPYLTKDSGLTGGLILVRETPWQPYEKLILDHLINTYALSFSLIEQKKKGFKKKIHKVSKRKYLLSAVIIIILAMFLPIRQSVIVPAEIVALDPMPITASIDGVIQNIFVDPNQIVQKGQKLFDFDPTDAEAEYNLAEKNWQVAKEKLRKSAQQYFINKQEKSQLEVLRAEVEKSKAEYDYRLSRLKKLVSLAPNSGLIIYDNPTDLIGKPVMTGEKIMELANPDKKQLLLWVPVSDAIQLNQGSQIIFFLNIDPLNPLNARLVYASYNAIERPNGTFAYRVEADFDKTNIKQRIGLQGQAKIYGERVSLFYYLFWRPIASLRQWIGI